MPGNDVTFTVYAKFASQLNMSFATQTNQYQVTTDASKECDPVEGK